jgi:hypothetical protein
MPRLTRSLPALLVSAAALAALPGCWIGGYTPGGQMASRDIYTYQSTADNLKTVTLVNTTTGQTVWQVDVPVERVVVMRFYDNDETSSTPKGSLMRWEFMTPFDASLGGDLNNVIPCPGRDSRQVVVTLRQPEKAPASPAVAPSAAPASQAPSRPPPEPAPGGMR